jgi:membrane AbrB-like protein
MNMLPHQAFVTLWTLTAGAIGAAIAMWLQVPVAVLIGPALITTALGLAGARPEIVPRLRDLCFLVLGLGIGAGFDPTATDAMATWPVVFVVIAILMVAIMVAGRWALIRWFGFDRRAAVLAAAPGHLSFVIAIATEAGHDVARIAVVQSVRLLSLTVIVPFIALAFGVEMLGSIVPAGDLLSGFHIFCLALAAVLTAYVFKRLRVPAPIVLGAMAVSVVGHVTETTPGVLPEWLMLAAFAVMGILIGTRFVGVSWPIFRSALGAGCAIMVISVGLSAIAAMLAAYFVGLSVPELLVGFAPGGFETMIAIGIVIGAPPGLIAACHVVRLLVLTVLVPLMLGRR